MDQHAPHNQPAFFILKVWEERSGNAHIEWRGELLDISANATQCFSDWPELVDIVATTLHEVRTQLCDTSQSANQGKELAAKQ